MEFASIFTIESLDQLFFQLPIESEKEIIDFASFDMPPFAVLAYAIGVEKACSLPGVYGNFLIKYADLDEAIKRTKYVLANVNRKSWEKARRFISVCSAGKITYQFDEEIGKIFSIWLTSLKDAKKRKVNYISLTFWCG